MKLAVFTTLLVGASAFTAPSKPAFTRLAMSEAVAEEAAPAEPAAPSYTCISKEAILASPNTIEFGQVWDPLGLADIGSDETLAWYRHAEVKHGRVAMAAFVGWWAVGSGLRFPGELAHGLDFASLPSKGLEAWDAVPGWGKAQLLLFAGLIEFHDELFATRRGEGGHYLRGGIPGKVRLKNKCVDIQLKCIVVHLKLGKWTTFMTWAHSPSEFCFKCKYSHFFHFSSCRTWFPDFSTLLDFPRIGPRRPRLRDATVRSRTGVLP